MSFESRCVRTKAPLEILGAVSGMTWESSDGRKVSERGALLCPREVLSSLRILPGAAYRLSKRPGYSNVHFFTGGVQDEADSEEAPPVINSLSLPPEPSHPSPVRRESAAVRKVRCEEGGLCSRRVPPEERHHHLARGHFRLRACQSRRASG